MEVGRQGETKQGKNGTEKSNNVKDKVQSILLFIGLEELNLESCGLTLLPKEIRNLPLKKLSLAKNEFEIIPRVISTLSQLTALDLRENRLKEVPLKLFQDLKQLQYFDLRTNPIVWPSKELANMDPNKPSEMISFLEKCATESKFKNYIDQDKVFHIQLPPPSDLAALLFNNIFQKEINQTNRGGYGNYRGAKKFIIESIEPEFDYYSDGSIVLQFTLEEDYNSIISRGKEFEQEFENQICSSIQLHSEEHYQVKIISIKSGCVLVRILCGFGVICCGLRLALKSFFIQNQDRNDSEVLQNLEFYFSSYKFKIYAHSSSGLGISPVLDDKKETISKLELTMKKLQDQTSECPS